MDTKLIFRDLASDLQEIHEKANERLLKEEQVRSSIYCSLKNQGYSVAAERNYNKKTEIESDLVFWNNNEPESWIEIKTSWFSQNKNDRRRLDKFDKNTWNNKPKEQFLNWIKDLDKLNTRFENKENLYFILVEQYDTTPLFDLIIKKYKYDGINRLTALEQDHHIFDLKWNKAPLDKCIIRIFTVNKNSH